MLAQTFAEYGTAHSIANAFAQIYNRVEVFLTTGNSRFLLFAGIAIIVVFFLIRRRS